MRVLVTGDAGYLASLLLPRLADEPTVETLLGVDVRAPRDPPARHRHIDVSVLDPTLVDVLTRERVDLVVHLAWVFNPTHEREAMRRVDVEGTRNVIEASANAGVQHVVYLSSTTAYGAHADNPRRLSETDRPRGSQFPYSADKAAVEALLDQLQAVHPRLGLTRLRPCIVLGSRTDNFVKAILDLPVIVHMRGCDTPFQFLHESDLAAALHQVVLTRPNGAINIAPDDTITLAEVARLIGRRSIAVPGPLLRLAVAIGWGLRLFSAPPSYLDFIQWPWIADVRKMRSELGFCPRFSSRDAVAAAFGQGRVESDRQRL